MSELTQTEDAIITGLSTITSLWDDMLRPTSSGSIARGSSGTGAVLDDKDPSEADTPRLERVTSARRLIVERLNGWARVIVEDHPIPEPKVRCSHGRNRKGQCVQGRRLAGGLHSVDGMDVDDLATFITTHARWLSGHEAAEDAATEINDDARRVRAIVFPERRDWVGIGDCPNTIGVEGVSMTCGTPVRVYPDRPGDIRCPGCSMMDTMDGWVARMVGDTAPVNATQLVALLHRHMGVVVKEATIRQWKSRGELVSVGADTSGRDLYDRHHAYVVVKRRDQRATG